MTDFMAKMHQIRFRLGLRPRPPAGGAYSAPDPLAVFGGLLLREGEGWRGEGGEGREESVPIVPVLRNDHCFTVLAPSDFSALKTLYDNLCTKLVQNSASSTQSSWHKTCFLHRREISWSKPSCQQPEQQSLGGRQESRRQIPSGCWEKPQKMYHV